VGQHWAVKRLDKNKHLYHCSTFFETETKELTGQCTERPGFPQKSAVEGPNVQRAMSVYIGGIALGLLADRPDDRQNRVLYLGPCSVHRGNPEVGVS
jgi:hypothetical protein